MCRFTLGYGITLRFPALQPCIFQPRRFLYESQGRILQGGRGGTAGRGASQVACEGFWGIWRAEVTFVVFLQSDFISAETVDDEVELEGGQKGGGQIEAVCGCNRRPRGGMLLIHVFHFQPLVPSSDIYSPPVISPDFSLLLLLASEPSALHPFSHYPPSLVVYSFALFYLSIYHTYPWCTWAVAVSCGPTAIIIPVALSDYSSQ